MNRYRRSLVAAAGAASIAPLLSAWAKPSPENPAQTQQRLVLSDFQRDYTLPGAGWRGFSDRVMGGISTATLNRDYVDGKYNIVCPWHGMEFDIRTGKFPGNHAMALIGADVQVQGGDVYVVV